MDEGRTFPLAAPQSAWGLDTKPARAAGCGIFATIVTSDRAAQGRTLARSVRECHPGARLAVLVPDTDATPPTLADLFDVVITADELKLASLADMRFRYTTAELCAALKPWLIRHLLERFADEPVYYLDPDIEIFSPLAEAEAALAQGANLVLTPHILAPGRNDDNQREVLRSGSFNAGFIAVAPSAHAKAFVAWWCERVKTGATNGHPDGTYGGQKWLELAPSICDRVWVLRHPGYNFAYWNGHERPLSCLGGTWTAAGLPLRFVHYSQWDISAQDAEDYLTRYFGSDYQPLAGLFAEYQKKVREEGSDAQPPAPVYAQVRSPAGEQVPDLIRESYGRHSPAIDGGAIEVYGRAVAMLNTPSARRKEFPDLPLSVLCDEIWRRHGDLRYRFDIDRKAGRLAYLQWLVAAGFAELQIPIAFTTEARAAVERERVRQLEEGEEATAMPVVEPATGEARRQSDDIRLLVRSNKALRREVTGLRVRRWRDDETIQALETDLAKARHSLDGARRRSRLLADEVAALRLRPWHVFTGWGRTPPPDSATGPSRQSMLSGEGPFFARGFRIGEGATTSGDTLARDSSAPAGFLVYGPYIKLPAGRYAVTLDARLHRRLPLVAGFRVEVVCDAAQQVIARRRYRLQSFTGWCRFELGFTLWDDEGRDDFEVRLWAAKGTPLAIRGLDLCRLDGSADG